VFRIDSLTPASCSPSFFRVSAFFPASPGPTLDAVSAHSFWNWPAQLWVLALETVGAIEAFPPEVLLAVASGVTVASLRPVSPARALGDPRETSLGPTSTPVCVRSAASPALSSSAGAPFPRPTRVQHVGKKFVRSPLWTPASPRQLELLPPAPSRPRVTLPSLFGQRAP
jgi:hypothetical protein